MKKKIIAVSLILILVIIAAEESNAIPAFARKYSMSCTTCHQPFPRLKQFGDDFAANAFRLEGQEPPRYFQDTGDEWLNLLRDFPIAVRLEGYGRYQPKNDDRSDFQTPYLIKLLSGGNIAKDIAYYFYFFFGERGEVAGLEDAYIMFNDVFNSGVAITFGQFQASDPIFKRETRLTFEDYQIYRTKVGESSVTLTYDRGLFLTYTLPTRTDLTFEILNGNGIGPADAGRNFDNDRYKNFMLRASQPIVDPIRVGVFGYYGKERQGTVDNMTKMYGPDLTIAVEPFEISVQYLERTDDRPLFTNDRDKIRTRGAFAEVVFVPEGDKGRWYAVGLYNWRRSDFSSLNYQTVTGHAGYLLLRNLRLIGEYSYDLEKVAHSFTVGFVSAF